MPGASSTDRGAGLPSPSRSSFLRRRVSKKGPGCSSVIQDWIRDPVRGEECDLCGFTRDPAPRKGRGELGSSLQSQIDRIVAAPAGGPNARVLRAGGTDDLFRLRDVVLAAMQRLMEPDEPLLVATRDKVRIAGAVLACLAGGNELILPHAESPPVLEELCAFHPVRFALAEDPGALPSGVAGLPLAERAAGRSLPRAVRRPGDPIVRLFTGGSTGRPRVWMKTVENLLGDAAFQAERFGVGPGDVILAAVTPQHIYGLLYTVFLPLVSGAAVVEETPCFQGEVESAVERYGATVFAGAPPHYRALRERSLAGHRLRLAVSSGGMLPGEDSLRFSAATGVPVTEIYGSTETGGIATRRRSEGELFWSPFPCVDWRIRRERLCVRSPFLSPGLERDRDGFFVTGDRVREAPGGGFDLLGRADGIVKVAGKRVDLEAVEARVKALPFIRDAYVLALAAPGMREAEIVCLVVPEPGARCPEDIRGALIPVLEPHDLPRRVRTVPEIPLTPAGKRDREQAGRLFEA